MIIIINEYTIFMLLSERRINGIISQVLNEYRHRDTITPDNTRSNRERNTGKNPLAVDNGNHASNDVVGQPSTTDRFGANFNADEHISLTQNQYIIYMYKNFANDKLKGSMSFFGNDTRKLRNAIDLLMGGAERNGKPVSFRTLTLDSSMKKAERSSFMIDTFWEFSLDGGNTWYIFKPKPLENLTQSKYKGGKS